MTEKQIVALLNEPSGSEENLEALAKEDFAKVEKVIGKKYTKEEIYDTFEKLAKAEAEMVAAVRKSTGSPEKAENILAKATAKFYNMIASISTDLLTFQKLILLLIEKDELPPEWREHFSPSAVMEKQRLVNIQSIRPTNYVMQVDNVFRNLPQLEGETMIYVGRKGRKEINTLVSLEMPEQFELEGIRQMDAYDKAVLNGVNSLFENGTQNFTIPMLYHAMTGKENPTVEEPALKELQRRIERMRRTLITIDLSEEIKAKYFDVEIHDTQVQGYLLPMNLIQARINGRQVQVYHLLDVPPMLAYAKMKRHLATVPLQILNAPLNNNATTIPLKSYLVARCESMRNQKNHVKSNKILFSAIYEELGEQDAGKVRKKRIRDYTEVVLQHMMEQNYIKSYEFTKTGRTIDGIKVKLYERT